MQQNNQTTPEEIDSEDFRKGVLHATSLFEKERANWEELTQLQKEEIQKLNTEIDRLTNIIHVAGI